jgi:hypothetical protein
VDECKTFRRHEMTLALSWTLLMLAAHCGKRWSGRWRASAPTRRREALREEVEP